MPCDSVRTAPQQTVAERMREIRSAAARIDQLIAAKKIQIKIGPQGAVTFVGISEEERKKMTDACIYRRIMASGSSTARMAIAKAEQLAGRTVDRRVVAQGIHSHDGGQTWHPKG